MVEWVKRKCPAAVLCLLVFSNLLVLYEADLNICTWTRLLFLDVLSPACTNLRCTTSLFFLVSFFFFFFGQVTALTQI